MADLYNFPGGHRTEPPDNGHMEERVSKLEKFAEETRDRLARIETRMDTFATKADLHAELNKQTWRFVGAVFAIGSALTTAVYFIARNVH